ncbi:MAG: phage baseplate assembly protein V [Betaproteobacteria bacterium]|nr:phage baseplate assembly protein V [Betaproteobacteria bacterium]
MIGIIQRIARRLQMLVGVGRVTLVDDSGPVQMMQLALGSLEVRDRTPRLAEFGFASNPPAGSDATLLFVGGDRSNGVVIATGSQALRLRDLQPGEAAIYDGQGKYVYLTETGIVVEAKGQPVTVNDASAVTVNASTSVTLNSPSTKITGTLEVDGAVTMKQTCSVTGALSSATSVSDPFGTMQGMREIYDAHDHEVAGVQGGSSNVTSNTPTQQM